MPKFGIVTVASWLQVEIISAVVGVLTNDHGNFNLEYPAELHSAFRWW